MRILLVGEYSRLHNSLKEGLVKIGHDVFLLSRGDGFKNYPSDYSIRNVILSDRPIPLFIRKTLRKLFHFDIAKIEIGIRFLLFFYFHRKKKYDIVQLININPIGTFIWLEKIFISLLKNNSDKIFLLSCGDEYINIKYALDRKIRYSILTPYLNNEISNNEYYKTYQFVLMYVTPPFVKLHNFVFNKINGVIPTDMDYAIPLTNHIKNKGLIPNPINTDKLHNKKINIEYPIVIFHGINRDTAVKKGNIYFTKALERLNRLYKGKIQIIETFSIPYDEYIKAYDSCHILLDQVYSFDMGYNALEAMAKGKVVFSGWEKETRNQYKLDYVPAINALPDIEYLYKQLEYLILNPHKVEEISNNAKRFIDEYHNYISIAKRYCSTWTKE